MFKVGKSVLLLFIFFALTRCGAHATFQERAQDHDYLAPGQYSDAEAGESVSEIEFPTPNIKLTILSRGGLPNITAVIDFEKNEDQIQYNFVRYEIQYVSDDSYESEIHTVHEDRELKVLPKGSLLKFRARAIYRVRHSSSFVEKPSKWVEKTLETSEPVSEIEFPTPNIKLTILSRGGLPNVTAVIDFEKNEDQIQYNFVRYEIQYVSDDSYESEIYTVHEDRELKVLPKGSLLKFRARAIYRVRHSSSFVEKPSKWVYFEKQL